jgi:hypothetical protein
MASYPLSNEAPSTGGVKDIASRFTGGSTAQPESLFQQVSRVGQLPGGRAADNRATTQAGGNSPIQAAWVLALGSHMTASELLIPTSGARSAKATPTLAG